jgi:predicted DNA-binding helix-hairpin-helix protein
MATSLNLRADRELWKYIYAAFPFASSLHLKVLPDYNHVWAQQLYQSDPLIRFEEFTPRHLRIIKAIERQARAMGFKVTTLEMFKDAFKEKLAAS